MKLNIQLFANGTITGSSTASIGRIQIVWTATAGDAIANSSEVKAVVQVKRSNAYNTTGTFSGTVTINGNTKSISKKFDPISNAWKTVGEYTVTVPHNDDGTKTCNIQTKLTQSGTSMAGTYTANQDVGLDTIARASVFNSITSLFTSTDGFTPNITKRNSGFYDRLTIVCDNTLIKTIDNVGNQTYTFTSGELNTLYSKYGNNKSKTLTFTLQTYADNTYADAKKVGYATSKTATCNLPAYSLSFNTSTLEDTITAYNTYKPNNKTYIVSLSKPRLTFNAVSSTGSTYGNTITYKVNDNAQNSPYTINNYTGATYKVVASDGRESATWQPEMTVIPYAYPTITSFSVVRPQATGSTADVNITIKYYDGNGLTNLIAKALTFTYQEANGTSGTKYLSDFSASESTSNHITTLTLTGTGIITGLDYKKSISSSATFTDRIGVSTGSIPTYTTPGLPAWNSYRDSGGTNHLVVNGDLAINKSPEPKIVMDTGTQSVATLLKSGNGTFLAGQGTIYFRPNDTYSNVGQAYINTDGKLNTAGEVQAGLNNSFGQFRALCGNYGFFIRNDGSNTYFMLTNSGDAYGQWNGLRPIYINNGNGYVGMGNGLGVSGELTINDNQLTITRNGTWFNVAPQNGSFTHYQTGAGAGHWFNKNVYVQGDVFAGSGYDINISGKYSGTKTAIGTWIDGNKVYRKIVTLSGMKKGNNYPTYDLGGLNTLISVRGAIKINNVWQPISRTVTDGNGTYGIGVGDVYNGYCLLQIGSSYSNIGTGYLVFEYT